MKRLLGFIFIVLSMFVATATLPALSDDSVKDTNTQVLKIPKDIKWGSLQVKYASDAQRYLYDEVKKEISIQLNTGAVRLKKIYGDENTVEYPDWKEYVKDIRVYQIAGYNSSGELVRLSEQFPPNTPNLATRTVYIKQDTCNLMGFNLFDFATWWAEDCKIEKESASKYLRAAMRTWSSMSENAYSLAASFRQEIATCLSSGEKFTLTNGVFSCPGNSKYFFGIKPFKMKQQLLSGGFWFKVDAKRRTATMTYLLPLYDEWAKTARWIPSDQVIRFSND